MDQIQFPDFMSEENMRKMSRQELVNLYLMMGQAMLPGAAEAPDPLTLPVAGERMEVPTRAGRIRAIFYKAKKPHAPVFFEMHGGGFVAGNCEDVDFWCALLRDQLDINVVNLNYRKAPQFPWPSAADDAFDTVKWFYEHAAEYDLDTGKMAIGGHSAGANLAAVICLRTLRESAPWSFKLQVLDYPPLDLRTSAFDKFSHPMAIPPQIAVMFDACYIAPGQGDDPLVSPAVAEPEELKGLPAACIVTAEYDSLRDEGELYGRKLIAAGVPVWSRRFLGSAHGFTMTLGGRDPMMPEDTNAKAACGMMMDALWYALS
ncbi:MAG: alpha/beta hydrolase [Oscillospiraceae bacterium]|nr:alpha/beta hydrolase [Oscillospiraceae bacterium]